MRTARGLRPLRRCAASESGAVSVEYAMVGAVIVAAISIGMAAMGIGTLALYEATLEVLLIAMGRR
jgi:Flp pilus assembly pilin Flp